MPSTRESYTSQSHAIAADVFTPPASGRHPACLVLHGTFGLLPEYRAGLFSFAQTLADAGVLAVLPHYLERTGTPPGPSAELAIAQSLSDWVSACADGLVFAANHTRVDAGRLGAIGFALGGHIAMTLAMSPPPGTTLKCVVDFFGPTLAPKLAGRRASMPPLQIHHGTGDEIVDIAESEQLVNELRAAGKVKGLGYEFFRYPHQGHGFSGADLVSSRVRTVAFVKASL